MNAPARPSEAPEPLEAPEAPEALEALLRERLGAAVGPRLAALEEEFGGLLDRGALLALLADEEGLLAPSEPHPGGAPAPAAPLPRAAAQAAVAEVAGILERLTATRAFRRGDGSVGFVCDAELRTPAGPRRVVLWDEAVRAAQGLAGSAVRLTGLAERVRGERRELHSTRATRVVRHDAGPPGGPPAPLPLG